MNPSKINRDKILKKISLDKKESKKTEDVNASKLSFKTEDNININYIDNNIDRFNGNKLDINTKSLLPSTSSINIEKITYKLDLVLNREVENLKSDKLVHISIFTIVKESNKWPFILYLLNKDSSNNFLYFPHFKSDSNIDKKSEFYLKEIFRNNTNINNIACKGYIEDNNNLYIFYQVDLNYLLIEQKREDLWWWVSIFEIVNTNQILNFDIDSSVFNIFYKNPLLISLFDDQNNKIQTPYIGYYGSYYTYVSFISIFGLPKQEPDNILGPYYYFYTYKGAGRGAIWSQTRKKTIINEEEITRDEFGLYKRGGIVRFIIFNKSIKYLINRETDQDDNSQITKDILNSKDKERESLRNFIKSTIKVRDVDGKWADKYDLAYIGSLFIKSEKYKDRKLDIQFAIKDYNQQFALSYHYIDTGEFTNVKNDTDRKNLPYEYNNYNIE